MNKLILINLPHRHPTRPRQRHPRLVVPPPRREPPRTLWHRLDPEPEDERPEEADPDYGAPGAGAADVSSADGDAVCNEALASARGGRKEGEEGDRRTGDEDTECDEELVRRCEGTPNRRGSRLSLVLPQKKKELKTHAEHNNATGGTHHGYCSAECADAETADETTDGELWPGPFRGELDDDADDEDAAFGAHRPPTAQPVCDATPPQGWLSEQSDRHVERKTYRAPRSAPMRVPMERRATMRPSRTMLK